MNKQLSSRVRYRPFLDRIVSAKEASNLIQDGMTVGLSGFTRAGEAKAVPMACIERARKDPFKINVYTGASLGSRIDELMAEVGLIRKRLPFQADRTMRKKINAGALYFIDQHLSHVAEEIRSDVLDPIDVAVIEAVSITEEGHIVPTTSVGNSSIFVKHARHVIIELNVKQPIEFEGVHDIYDVGNYEGRVPIPMQHVNDRIGTNAIQVDPEKVVGIVLTEEVDSPSTISEPDEDTEQIAAQLIAFLNDEIEKGRLTNQLAPIQAGIGSVANAVLYGLLDTPWTDIDIYSEVLQDAIFDLMDAGRIRFASGCSITLSEQKMNEMRGRLDEYKKRLVLRPQEITNHPEIIRRLGLISINTAIEADIYGNVNSTHIGGTHMMNGIGGSGDFARNARLSIFVTKSTAKNRTISSIVPFVSHVDHTEHDVNILITEQGYADLRGLAPIERAKAIIDNCVHPQYRPQMKEYFHKALAKGGHTPHVLEEAFSWHIQLKEKGTMMKQTVVTQSAHANA